MADGFVSLLLTIITALLYNGTNARFAKGNVIATEGNQGVAKAQVVNEGKQQNKLEYDDGYFGPNHQSPYYNYKGNFEVPWNKKNFKQELNSGYEKMRKLRKDVLSKVLYRNRMLRIPSKRKHLDGFHVRKRRQVLQAYLIRDGGKPLASNSIKINLNERQARIIWPDLPSEYDDTESDRVYSVGSLEQWFNYPLTTPAHPNPAWHLPTLCREYKPEQTRVKRAARVGIKERRRKREKKKRDKKRRKAKKKIEKIKKLAKKRKRKKKKKGGKGGKRKSPKPRVRTSNATQEFESISIPDSDWSLVKTDEEDTSYYSDDYEEEEITNEKDEYRDETVNNDKNKTKDNKNKVEKTQKTKQHRKVDNNRLHTMRSSIHLVR